MSGNDDEKGFVIKDRRIFSDERAKERDEKAREQEDKQDQAPKPFSEENERKEEQSEMSQEDGPVTGEQEPEPKQKTGPKQAPGDSRELHKIDFSGFIFSLYASAAFHFGDMADPATGKQEKNLPAAKQMIELIAMLKEKTEGNLNEEEKRTIETLLYELRMRYVKES